MSKPIRSLGSSLAPGKQIHEPGFSLACSWYEIPTSNAFLRARDGEDKLELSKGCFMVVVLSQDGEELDGLIHPFIYAESGEPVLGRHNYTHEDGAVPWKTRAP